ncbi:IPT/TIG domain protein [Lysinibacillus yapensis]|uniref:IPT/TIG domain protein n=2 Tax=Ureibacillus yapensis TaxID=2304605 RepID=A0A396S6V8_9BACL|nr:IPT/TIG domain protein [Lysinibacillus yapensis]
MTVGPINPLNGFPVWYKDQNGLRLMLNTDPNDPFSLITPADLPNPGQPVAFPGNFPSEAFYFIADAEMEFGNVEARLVLALEGAFVNEVPVDGEQIVFGRVRIRVEGLQPGATYTVMHPYGIDEFVADQDGEINFTEDIGGMDGGNFELALNSRVFPFISWDSNIPPAAPAGYIGDPNELHEVAGSLMIDPVTNQPLNIFRIEGPGIGIGSPFQSTTPGYNPDNTIETRLFSLAGKISTISGVDVPRTTYTQSTTEHTLDVFAESDVGPQTIEVTGEGINPTILQGENGLYFARVNYVGDTPPATVTVTNVSDNPPSVKESIPTDFITAIANYNNETKILTVTASSSDEINPVTLTVLDFGMGEIEIPAGGVLELSTIMVPASITIQSTAGGTQTIPITVSGSNNPPVGVRANAGADQTVLINTTVELDGSGSTGPITSYQWTQTEGEPVNLLNANEVIAAFVAPDVETTLTFSLTVEGDGGPSTDIVVVRVLNSAQQPIANGGGNQIVQQGAVVALAGSATGEVTSYLWEQVGGPPVQLTNPNTPTASFTFPREFSTLTFRFTVSGPGGSSSDEVQISTRPDSLTVTRAEFRTRDTEWRISGTSTVLGAKMTIHIGNSLSGNILAEVSTDALGEWQYRVGPSTVQPDGTRAISIQSSSGGTLVNVPINVRN